MSGIILCCVRPALLCTRWRAIARAPILRGVGNFPPEADPIVCGREKPNATTCKKTFVRNAGRQSDRRNESDKGHSNMEIEGRGIRVNELSQDDWDNPILYASSSGLHEKAVRAYAADH